MDEIICEACGGKGYFYPANPDCDLSDQLEQGEEIVERCDTCMTFSSDLYAALFISNTAREFRGSCGGIHTVVQKGESK
jgi:hypothetical protein